MRSSPAADIRARYRGWPRCAPRPPPSALGGRRPCRHAQTWRPWLLLAPALVVLGALLLFPLARVVVLSFQDFGLRELITGGAAWVGLANYRELLTDPLLWQTVLPNTVVFAVVNVVLTVVFGTLVALLLFRLGRWMRGLRHHARSWSPGRCRRSPARTCGSSSSTRSAARRCGCSTASAWSTRETTNWFTERLTFYAIATLNVVHHGFPFVAVTVLAGLMTMPQDVIEAATIDGAGGWRRFWSITAPMLKPVFAVVTILSTIWDFKVFTQIYLMPGGNGANRDVLNLGTWSYITAFGQGTDYGLGARRSPSCSRSCCSSSRWSTSASCSARTSCEDGQPGRRILRGVAVVAVLGVHAVPGVPDALDGRRHSGQRRHAQPAADGPDAGQLRASCSTRAASRRICATRSWSRSARCWSARCWRCSPPSPSLGSGSGSGRAVLVMMLIVQMVPLEALVIPLFIQARNLHLLNSLVGLVVVYVAFSLPFAIWMLRGFVAAVPEGDRGGGVRRRRVVVADVLVGPLAARRARPGRDQRVLVHHRVERVHLRPHVQHRGQPGQLHRVDRAAAASSASTAPTGGRSWPARR